MEEWREDELSLFVKKYIEDWRETIVAMRDVELVVDRGANLK